MNASKTRPTPRKVAPKKVDISKLNNEELNSLPEEVFIASLTPWARRFLKAAEPFKGKLKAVK
jgi:hypothetical protein